MKVFEENRITAKDKVLSYDEFIKNTPIATPEIDPEKAKIIIAEAEKLLDEEIPFVTLYSYREFKITGNRSNFQRPYAKRRNMLHTIALAEYCEGKGRFTSKMCDLVWAILEETTWVVHAHASHNPADPTADVPPVYNESDLHGIDLFAGATGALLTMVLTLNRAALDSLSPIIAERMEYEIQKRVIKPFTIYIFTWSGSYGTKCNNWCTWITDNLLYITAMLEKRQGIRQRVVERALAYLDNYTSYIPDDGGCDEGPGYWGAAGACYFSALELLYEMTGGAIDVYSTPLVRYMGEYIAKMNINDNKFINFADCGPTFYPDGYLIMRYGERCGSESRYAFGKMMAPKCEQVPGYTHINKALRDLIMPMPNEKLTTKAERFVWMPSLKVMTARESEDTSKGMFLAIKGGHNKESHNHNDVGSYVIYSDGEPAIIDPGSCTYTRDTFGKNRYTIWCMQSHYHNLPAFDGEGEKNGAEYRSTREAYDEQTHSISLGLEEAYAKEAGVEEFTRSACLNGGTVTVSDDIHLDAEREIDFRLMTHREPEVVAPGKLILNGGVVLEYDPALEYELESFVPAQSNPMERWGTPVLYRMHFKTKAKEYKCDFKYYKQ